MDLELPEELRLLKATVREFVDRELIPNELKADDGGALRPEVRADLEKKARDLGLWMLDVPSELGGEGLGALGMVVVWEELSRSIAIAYDAPGIFGPEYWPLARGMSPSQEQQYLHPALRAERRLIRTHGEPELAMEENSTLTRIQRIQRGGDGGGEHYRITGNRRYVDSVAAGDFLQVLATVDGADGLSLFLVDCSLPGVTVGAVTRTVTGDERREISLEDVKVPAENRVGPEGGGLESARSWITMGRLYQACRGLGVASRCLDMSASYAKQRVTFGAPIADRQAVQFMLSDTQMEHRLAQLLIYDAALKLDAGLAAWQEGAMAKLAGMKLAQQAADRCMQIHGGMGMTNELPIERMWRRARAARITEGSSDALRGLLARGIVDGRDARVQA